MKLLEKTITALIVVVFVWAILFINNIPASQVYDCNQLHIHPYVPNQIIEECFKVNKPVRSISI